MLRTQLSVLVCLLCCTPLLAQEEVDLFDLSLEELMNVEIVSASKKSENLFDAPVSSYSITRDEIARAGSTSIPEALRLCPGVIVRETTNGNYDIHLRGFDNLFRYSEVQAHNNVLTLVMIDDRPVFNHNTGGTVWESLPIDLVDVERIEIVRGPAAPLFGPNAVTGVINIITRRADKPGLYVSSHLQYGTPEVLGANVAVGNKFSDQLDVIVSANYQQRKRSDEGYYVYDGNFYDDIQEANVPFAAATHAEPELSLDKRGINGFVNYQPRDQVALSLAAGWQQAEAQRMYYNFNIAALNTSTIDRSYVQLDGTIHNIGARISHTIGSDDMYKGFAIINPRYDVANTDVALNYQWKISDQLNLRPELSYQRAVLDDRDYVSDSAPGFVNGKVSNQTVAASLKAEYYPVEALRLIGAVRVDKFETPDRAYASYQLAATYKLNDKYLLRAVQSRSTSGAFISNYLLDIPTFFTNPTAAVQYSGNADMNVASNTMTELGLRAQVTQGLQLDLTLFQQRIKDLSYPFNTGVAPLTEEVILATFQYLNLPTEAVQRGLTLSANFVPSSRLQFKPFVTVQATQVEDLPIGSGGDFANRINDEHQTTPSVYGGGSVNYRVHPKLNLNLNAYYFDQHIIYHQTDLPRLATTGETYHPKFGPISSKLITNLKVTYQVVDKLNVYVNGRNLLGQNTREHHATDRIGRSYFVGASYNF